MRGSLVGPRKVLGLKFVKDDIDHKETTISGIHVDEGHEAIMMTASGNR
jgi:hypothetical protein